MDGSATQHLHDILDQHAPKRVVLVMGSEGDGMRRLVSEHCEYLAKIPMPGGFESLNVSHATAIALYEALGRRQSS
jgi:23S rRNA (guanosine2251-2'-O)-methyltransferase